MPPARDRCRDHTVAGTGCQLLRTSEADGTRRNSENTIVMTSSTESPVMVRRSGRLSTRSAPQIIPASLPGAGNLRLFDDRGEAGYPPAKPVLSPAARASSRSTRRRSRSGSIAERHRPDGVGVLQLFHQSRPAASQRKHVHRRTHDGRFFQVTPASESRGNVSAPILARHLSAGAGRK
jgi:hypothetical protein